LRKLQLISEAKQLCPDVVIVLGEDLSRFRNASKLLYAFLRAFSWNARCERLGFDEVFMDVTDLIDYNLPLLNHSRLAHSFFCLDKSDPSAGFPFDATALAGHAYPAASIASPGKLCSCLHGTLCPACATPCRTGTFPPAFRPPP
jgi:DNA polymerase iota